MSIRDLIDAKVHCCVCGTQGIGNCDCWRTCECGLWVRKEEQCEHEVHGALGSYAKLFGYWVLNADTGKPYKTRASLPIIRKRMDEGTIFFTRKEANQAVRDAVERRPK